MQRRQFLGALGIAAAAWPLVAQAQQPTKVLRVGSISGLPRTVGYWQAFLQRMAELGHSEGKNFTFELLHAPNINAYASAYGQLVAGKPDIIIATGPELSLKSAIAATQTLPIVMIAIDYDPFARGYVTSLARPTGNVTGLYLQQIELMVKRLQLVKDAFPDMRAATVFWDRLSADQWEAARDAGAKLGVKVAGVELRDQPYNYDWAFAEAPQDHRHYLFIPANPFFFRDRALLADLALRNRIVSMLFFREMVEAGGLLSYGPNVSGMFQRAAEYVDRLARGSTPADLPIEQPTKFELIVNLKAAKAIGVTIPSSLLAYAEHVIE